MKRQILLLDTDLELCSEIKSAIQDNQVEVINTMSEVDAMSILTQSDCYMVIMGVLPSVDEALKIVHRIRSITTAPILLIAENVEKQDKVRLFREGITVYLEKPFDMDICAAQANSLIQLYAEARAENREDAPLVFGSELMVNPIYRQVMIDGEILDLTRTEFELFVCLAKHQCQIWSYSQLYRHVLNDTLGLDGDNAVKTHIGNLKKKLENLGKHYIQNSRGIGYKFVPPKCEKGNHET